MAFPKEIFVTQSEEGTKDEFFSVNKTERDCVEFGDKADDDTVTYATYELKGTVKAKLSVERVG
jgi:hypothetical protein